MRWVLTEAPDYAEEWYDGALCALEHFLLSMSVNP